MEIMQHLSNESMLVDYLAYSMIFTAVATYLALQFLDAPYGRYGSPSWGFMVPGKVAWVVQELPSFTIPVVLIAFGNPSKIQDLPNQLLMSMFLLHYLQRTFIFPLLIRGGKPTPAIPFILALVFCLWNGYMQGRTLSHIANYPTDWTSDVRFITGAVLFFTGMAINIHSDHILRNLRKPGETGYKIPEGGMFDFVSGANFLGEIIEWTGFAIACWNLQGAAFAIYTASNIGPRAMGHHQWYLKKFAEKYPKSRKALIPFLF